ncbi:MAG: hypothetical protein ACD_81C00160G0001 [uncultured bacterium]|uniref:Bis(5'-nucleosyl)-tetraphosphatase [asymmetrical] n=2 Tax=Candidatus Wolfeibacteriota TaxID=1752735 RepID=A0A0G1JH02_9BACT|nr:MAG: hypothetical protein ACD_81C00160G0001 [uncultured bacterium]KKR12384.1 MAG: hypothetical protein UT41_C0002G0158 [Candidatus Wolfebacteria bacterium GW2011_GWC2_39_22]KKT43292.1 MAG: hypothetical protein UW32_C0002G0153 [Candidatus Wolfebacteria bacterium GW2011_GWE2_44_13]
MREISAGIIAYRKTAEGPRFLILYHGHNYWNFPKGKIESEEKSFQTAVREVREETGLTRNDLRFDESFKTSENFTFWRNKEKIYKTIVFYLAETTQQRIKLPEQTDAEGEKHEGYGWFTYKEALKVLVKEDSQRVLKQAHNFLRNLEGIKTGVAVRRPRPQRPPMRQPERAPLGQVRPQSAAERPAGQVQTPRPQQPQHGQRSPFQRRPQPFRGQPGTQQRRPQPNHRQPQPTRPASQQTGI